jgi:hypothetical protein
MWRDFSKVIGKKIRIEHRLIGFKKSVLSPPLMLPPFCFHFSVYNEDVILWLLLPFTFYFPWYSWQSGFLRYDKCSEYFPAAVPPSFLYALCYRQRPAVWNPISQSYLKLGFCLWIVFNWCYSLARDLEVRIETKATSLQFGCNRGNRTLWAFSHYCDGCPETIKVG